MDPQTQQLLKENLDIAKANNELLNKLVRSHKRANIYRVVYWGLIIFFSFGAYYFIQPLLGNLLNAYGVSGSNGSSFQDISKSFNSQQMQDFVNAMKSR